jgi:hypothetical protein
VGGRRRRTAALRRPDTAQAYVAGHGGARVVSYADALERAS